MALQDGDIPYLFIALSTVSVETVTVSCLPKSTHLSASAVVLM